MVRTGSQWRKLPDENGKRKSLFHQDATFVTQVADAGCRERTGGFRARQRTGRKRPQSDIAPLPTHVRLRTFTIAVT